jgi:hypothetical protein
VNSYDALSPDKIRAPFAKIGIATVTIAWLCACSPAVQLLDDVTGSADIQPTGEAFFESTGGWDYGRIALIEPYQAVSVDDKTWSINLRTRSIQYQYTVTVTKLDVIDRKAIVTYAPNATLAGEQAAHVWFVIIPSENVERGFTDKADFSAYLTHSGIPAPNLTAANAVYQDLLANGSLPWFPDTCSD